MASPVAKAKMPTSAVGNKPRQARGRGFTLLELLVVIAIIAIASAGVSFSLRDAGQTQLEREAQRLAALLESARAQSRATGVAVRWSPNADGFSFDGLPSNSSLPHQWLSSETHAIVQQPLLLGPEPLIGHHAVALTASSAQGRTLWVTTDGLRPFAVKSDEQAAP